MMLRRAGRTLLLAGLLAIAVLLLDRQRGSDPTHTAEWLRAGDVHVRALRTGAGDTTVVLLHGYGESLLAWRALVDPLARRRRVVALDIPGFGLSEKPDAPYDLPAQRRRLEAFLAAHTSGPLVLVGHSMGGELAAALALALPERVVGLVLIDAAGWGLGTPVADAAAAATILGAAAPATSFVLPIRDRAWLADLPGTQSYTPLADPAARRAAARVLQEYDFAALADSGRFIRQPTLVIWGAQDPTIPLAVGRRIAADLPQARLAVISGALHRPHQAQPAEVLRLIEAFLGD